MQTNESAQCKRIQVNDTKAGMQDIDKEKINQIILKHSQSKRLFDDLIIFFKD